MARSADVGYRFLVLDVDHRNDALAFYEREGFSRIIEKPNQKMLKMAYDLYAEEEES